MVLFVLDFVEATQKNHSFRQQERMEAVSYTHLDVYKRQVSRFSEIDFQYVSLVVNMIRACCESLSSSEEIICNNSLMISLGLNTDPGACLLYTSRCV